MKFICLSGTNVNMDNRELEADIKAARQIGSLCFGEKNLYVKKMMSAQYIPYASITRYFRRVEKVNMMMCCGKGSLDLESIVVCLDDTEVVEEKMPDTRAALAAVSELKKRASGADDRPA